MLLEPVECTERTGVHICDFLVGTEDGSVITPDCKKYGDFFAHVLVFQNERILYDREKKLTYRIDKDNKWLVQEYPYILGYRHVDKLACSALYRFAGTCADVQAELVVRGFEVLTGEESIKRMMQKCQKPVSSES